MGQMVSKKLIQIISSENGTGKATKGNNNKRMTRRFVEFLFVLRKVLFENDFFGMF
ncbi:hypothetical protein [Bacillus sp. OTU530]|uniref:hypothetical protein n=1 Tax=Bacillus sp. OTU530 TaxID=3043862 RepID=UPI00313B76A7